MKYSVSKRYSRTTFAPGALRKAVVSACGAFGLDPEKSRYTQRKQIEPGTSQDGPLSQEDLDPIVDLRDIDLNIYLQFGGDASPDGPYLSISGDGPDILRMYVSSSNIELAQNLCDYFKTSLNLQVAPPDERGSLTSRIELLENRLSVLADTLHTRTGPLRCFVSYRFSSTNKPVALELIRFLEILGISVITGAEYQPRSVSEKVREKLAEQLDFLIYLILKDGSSTWTRDEMAFGFSKGHPVVPIIEDSASLDAGILGDWEYITFASGHIGDSFLPLLEAIRYIRSKRVTESAANDA